MVREDESQQVKASDLFPELHGEIDRRIAAAETRIKLWLVVGLATNMLAVFLFVAQPLYKVGQFTERMESFVETSLVNERELREQERRLLRLEMGEAQAK